MVKDAVELVSGGTVTVAFTNDTGENDECKHLQTRSTMIATFQNDTGIWESTSQDRCPIRVTTSSPSAGHSLQLPSPTAESYPVLLCFRVCPKLNREKSLKKELNSCARGTSHQGEEHNTILYTVPGTVPEEDAEFCSVRIWNF